MNAAMEGSKKYEDAALRGITRHHVWKSRTSDLTVINLRDPSELLGTQQEPPVTLAVAEVRRAAPPVAATPTPPPPARPTTGKQESLNALLAKLQQGRPSMEALSQSKTPQLPTTPPAAMVHTSAAPSSAPAQASPPAAAAPVPMAAPAPAPAPPPVPPAHARAAERHDPTFPDTKESSPAPAGQFEFITGTNIPGQGVVKKKDEKVDEASSMALFHDPLWGGTLSLDSFSASPPVKRSPKPQARASLSELYSSAANAFTATPPASNPTPMASPPVAEMTASAMPAPMAAQPMPMMPGLVPAPAPTLTTSYPMYSVPLQYMAQPQFPAGVVYNSPAFFQYGATPMMVAQPQAIPQGYAVPAAAMMRPGTNVKAMPFVPGSAM